LGVQVDHEHPMACEGEGGGEVGDGDRLADAALLAEHGGDDHAAARRSATGSVGSVPASSAAPACSSAMLSSWMRCMTASPWARRIHAPTSSARSAVVVAKMIERASGC